MKFSVNIQKITILILVTLMLVACSQSGGTDDGQSDMSGDQPDAASVPDSPRAEAPPTATVLPPTWTPMPIETRKHLADAPDRPSITGTRVEYTVKRGDTLAEICNRYGASISEVARINNISNWDRIEVGQVLTLPVGGN